MLEELHETHLGASRMKGLARGYVWWPKMDEDIEEVAKQCSNRQQAGSSPSKAPLHPWEFSICHLSKEIQYMLRILHQTIRNGCLE